MPRVYKPGGTKHYKKYDELTMQVALNEYNNSNLSLGNISAKYDIPKSVLQRHNTRFMKKPGGQPVLSAETEEYIVENLNHCAEWGYPLDTYDLRVLVKGYLDRSGITEKRFRDNLPGPDFVKSFLQRNKNKISLRISQNIKRCRASVSPQIIEEYFIELEKSLEGVPMCNVVNYDETNLSDDPGRRKVITKRGAKYPERVVNHSKASTSIMMAAAGDGTLLPCYVVYKAKNLYESWVQNGPKGCRYNCTTSGWFDSITFEDWVRTVAMPYFNNKDGKKILIGDNLSSHLSLGLINECKEQNVHFIFLPPNSTHLTQPLDVAFFRAIKDAWRDILFQWKKTDGCTLPTIPKSVFPSLLKKLLNRIANQTKSNILSAFMKSGINPLNKIKVLERLPGNACGEQSFDKDALDETVVTMLKEMRYGTGNNKPCNKRKKIEIKPGQSVCTDTEVILSTANNSDQEESNFLSNESDLEENLQLSERISASSTNNESECHEDSEIQPKSTLKQNYKPQHKIAKLIPEDRKRKFEEKASMAMTTMTKPKLEPTIVSNTSNQPNQKLEKQKNYVKREQNKRTLSKPGCTDKFERKPINKKAKSNLKKIVTQETHKEVKQGQLCNEAIKLKQESCHMVEDQENRNDEYIFKKPTTLREYKKNKNEGINKPNQETKGRVVRMDTDNNTEEVTIFNDVSNYELLNDLDKFDIENMPLILIVVEV